AISLYALTNVAKGIIFAISLYALTNVAKGNHFDFKTKSWYPNGMIIFTSRPSGAKLYINEKLSKYKIGSNMFPTKLNIFEPGENRIRVEKKGYLSWNKTMTVYGGLVISGLFRSILYTKTLPRIKES
ncbi:MAG: hypothetical protein UT60_C0002G0001, partial [candidate division CPR2 bacterium GW2011_GWD2_39_7]